MSDTFEKNSTKTWFSINNCKKVAKDQLNGRKTTPVLAVLICFAIYLVVYMGIAPFSDIFKSSFGQSFGAPLPSAAFFVRTYSAGILLGLFITIARLAGLMMVNRMFKTSDVQKLGQFFADFKHWWKAIRASLWVGLWAILWYFAIVLPPVLVIAGLSAASVATGATGLYVLFIFVTVILVVYMIVALCWKLYQYSMMFYVLADDENVGVVEALRISRRITKGYKWNLFVFDLSFIGWYLLSCLTLGILGLWILPYYGMARTNAYMYIKRVDGGWNPSEDTENAVKTEAVEAPAETKTEE